MASLETNLLGRYCCLTPSARDTAMQMRRAAEESGKPHAAPSIAQLVSLEGRAVQAEVVAVLREEGRTYVVVRNSENGVLIDSLALNQIRVF